MLEDHFVVPAAAQRLRSCVLGAHLGEICSLLVDLGYEVPTIRYKLWVLSGLARWMENKEMAVRDLDERRTDEFVDARRRRGRTFRGFRFTALQLIEQLRSLAFSTTTRKTPQSTIPIHSPWG